MVWSDSWFFHLQIDDFFCVGSSSRGSAWNRHRTLKRSFSGRASGLRTPRIQKEQGIKHTHSSEVERMMGNGMLRHRNIPMLQPESLCQGYHVPTSNRPGGVGMSVDMLLRLLVPSRHALRCKIVFGRGSGAHMVCIRT